MRLAVTFALLLIPAVQANSILNFSVFGNNSATLNTNVTVSAGLVGSNLGLVSIGGGSNTQGIQGGGALTTGLAAQINGDAIFSSNFQLGGSGDVFGNVDSGGNITLNNNSTIHGNATASGTITVNSGASITGTSTPSGSPTPYSPVTLPTVHSYTGGGPNESTTNGTLNLAPNTYGALSTGSSATVDLSAGTYVFDSIGLGGGNTLNFTLSGSQQIVIEVVGNVTIGTNLQVFINGVSFLSADPLLIANIYLEDHGTFTLGGGSDWFGTIYSSNGQLTFNSTTRLRGAVYGGTDVNIGGGSQINFIASNFLTQVPEPLTPVMSGMGLLLLWLMRSKIRR